MSAGLSATSMPAALRAASFSAAVPLPPEMIAPAWPMRLPGGAVRPAMNAATGLVTCCFHVGGGFFFGRAADFAHHQNRFGLRDRPGTSCNRSMNDVPTIGSPPRPTHVDWPKPKFVNCHTAS